MSVNSEDHVLGLWIGGGVTPGALQEIEGALRDRLENNHHMEARIAFELDNMANACRAQLSKLPKPDPARYL